MTEAKPPIYEYINGHAYMLASHAAEQMERVIALTKAELTSECECDVPIAAMMEAVE